MPVWPDEVQAFLRKALEPNGDAKLMTVAGCRSVVDSTYAAREGFTESTPLEEINEHLDYLVDYRNFARYKISGFEIYTTFKIRDCHYRKMI